MAVYDTKDSVSTRRHLGTGKIAGGYTQNVCLTFAREMFYPLIKDGIGICKCNIISRYIYFFPGLLETEI